MSIEVEKIVLKIGRKTIELSVEEAIELREVLGDVVGKTRTEKEYIPYYPPYVTPGPLPYRYWTTTGGALGGNSTTPTLSLTSGGATSSG